jgi:hypothetical protein
MSSVRHQTRGSRFIAREAVILGSLLLTLAVSVPGRAAEITYKLQRIVTAGDTIAGVAINRASRLHAGALNDKGQLALWAGPQTGGPGGGLFVFADGTFTPIVVGGQDGPVGKWPPRTYVSALPRMNQRGNVAFASYVNSDGKTSMGIFLWDAHTQKTTVVSLPGMPAVNGLTFLPTPVPGYNPQINNQDEITFTGHIADAAGKSRPADFFLGRDQILRPVVLPGQELPGGGTIRDLAGPGNVNDAGVIVIAVGRSGDPGGARSAYQWENGTLTPLALVGGDVPGGGKITRVTGVRVNNQNHSVLLALHASTTPKQAGLYRFAEGQLTPLAVPGQPMPEGGKLATILEEYPSASGPSASGDWSPANELGQHVFRARLEDGTRSLYRVDPDGTLTLLLKQGAATEQGAITSLLGGRGIGFNRQGQIALTVQIAGGPETLVLLTPAVQ